VRFFFFNKSVRCRGCYYAYLCIQYYKLCVYYMTRSRVKRRSLEALYYNIIQVHTTITGSMTRPCKLICTKTIIDWHCLINKVDIHNAVMSSAAALLFYIFVIIFVLTLSFYSGLCPSCAFDDALIYNI